MTSPEAPPRRRLFDWTGSNPTIPGVDGRALPVVGATRGSVLRLCWQLVTFVNVPYILIVLLVERHSGTSTRWLLVEGATMLICALGMPIARRRSIDAAAALFLVTFGIFVCASVLQYGFVFGSGLFYVSWLMAFVYFSRTLLLPIVVPMGAMVVVALIVRAGVAGAWTADNITTLVWTRMGVSITATTIGLAMALHAVMRRLERALADESEARTRAAEAHAQREASLQGAANMQRMESLGRLAGGIAHDFNNVLALLVLGVDELQDPSLTAAERAVVLDEMARGLRGARATTTQLLAIATPARARGIDAQIGDVLKGLAGSLRRLFPETIEIRTHIEGPATATISGGELEQVLLNLALNARDAMPDGGVLMLRSRRATAADGPASGSFTIVEVQDTGTGMVESVRLQAMEPFFTTKEQKRGSGLGLAMVEAQVRRAGGSVGIESVRGSGTTVRLRLPVATNADEPSPRATPTAVAVALAGARAQRVLYLEDDPALRRLTTRALHRAGYVVVEADTVEAAARRIADDGPFEFFLTDAVLPDGNPASAISSFREGYPGQPVLLVSGYVETDGLVQGIALTELPFLQKPFKIRTLLDRMQELLDGRT